METKTVFEKTVSPLTGMRRTIAKNVMRSLKTSAQVTSFFDVDATGILASREALAAETGPSEQVGFNALFIAGIARTLRRHPLFNAYVQDDQAVIYESINVGVAIALDESFGLGGGLIVPVICKADEMTVSAIERELAIAISKARGRMLSPSAVQGGTFTLTNLGALPGAEFWRGATPVINGSQSAILGIGRIMDAVVVGGDGSPLVRPQVPLSLTHDHRLIDGAAAGAFVSDLVATLSDRTRLAG